MPFDVILSVAVSHCYILCVSQPWFFILVWLSWTVKHRFLNGGGLCQGYRPGERLVQPCSGVYEASPVHKTLLKSLGQLTLVSVPDLIEQATFQVNNSLLMICKTNQGWLIKKSPVERHIFGNTICYSNFDMAFYVWLSRMALPLYVA